MTPKEEFIHELKTNVKRAGIDDLIKYLSKTDFFTAPASTHYHGAHEQGLLLHSLAVLDAMRGMNKLFDMKISEEQLVIVSLLHDICKANFYAKEKRNKKIDGQWREIEVWTVKDQFPMGHGEKSLYLVVQHMGLTDSEALAIRWHMGGFEPSVHFQYPSGAASSQAMRQNKLLAMLASADIAASYLTEEWED